MFFLPLLLHLSISLYLEKGGVPQKEENPLLFCFFVQSLSHGAFGGAGLAYGLHVLVVTTCMFGNVHQGHSGQAGGQGQGTHDPGWLWS